jgi:hypothetical protein
MSALDKFKQLETTFNKNFMKMLGQLNEKFEDDEKQCDALETAYSKWYGVFSENIQSMEGCKSFYDAIKENHDMVLKRDERLFTCDGDFLANVYQEPTIDTTYIYSELSDGSDTDNPIENDARGNLWEVLIGLYRLSVLLCIYLKMPLVKEIIDMILLDNPDLNQSNIVTKIFQDFKGKRKLRQLIMKLLKSKGDNFKDIFTSLQRVVASFGSECAVDPSKFANSAEASRTKVNQDFDEILKSVGLEDMKTEEKESLMKAIETKTTPENVVITKENLQKVEKLFFEKNLDKSRTISNSVHDLGQNMSSLMSAIESGDESKMEEIFKSTGTSEMFKGVDMSQFKGEMEGEFEKEFNELEEDAEAVD